MPTTYHTLEVPTSLLIKAFGFKFGDIFALLLLSLDRLLLGGHLGIDLHIEVKQVVNGVFLKCLLVAVFLVCESQQTVLLTPVSQICKKMLA